MDRLPLITFANSGKKDDEFISLFNGKDLTHWNTTGNWIPQKDGSLLIQPKRGQKGWQRYSDYLISKEKFGDFILKLEYKYPPKGNSGIFFRIGDPKQPVKTGIECQILDSSGKPMIDGTPRSWWDYPHSGSQAEHVQKTGGMEPDFHPLSGSSTHHSFKR